MPRLLFLSFGLLLAGCTVPRSDYSRPVANERGQLIATGPWKKVGVHKDLERLKLDLAKAIMSEPGANHGLYDNRLGGQEYCGFYYHRPDGWAVTEPSDFGSEAANPWSRTRYCKLPDGIRDENYSIAMIFGSAQPTAIIVGGDYHNHTGDDRDRNMQFSRTRDLNIKKDNYPVGFLATQNGEVARIDGKELPYLRLLFTARQNGDIVIHEFSPSSLEVFRSDPENGYSRKLIGHVHPTTREIIYVPGERW